MTAAADLLFALLQPERLTAVVDIGANPLSSDGEPPYKAMLAKRLCTLTGFEPQRDALAVLNAQKSDLETYLPYAVGDGGEGTLKLCRAPGMSSMLTPDARMLEFFPHFNEYGVVLEEIPLLTHRLDDISEIKALDLLKIDVQGGELTAFRGGGSRLAGAVALQCEVSFIPFYKNQPVYGDVDLALRALGFVPHMFASINRRMILPLHDESRPHVGMNQLIEADAVYVRDFTQPDRMSVEQLKHLALIAHHCYQSYDLVMKCIHDLILRGATPPDTGNRYWGDMTGR